MPLRRAKKLHRGRYPLSSQSPSCPGECSGGGSNNASSWLVLLLALLSVFGLTNVFFAVGFFRLGDSDDGGRKSLVELKADRDAVCASRPRIDYGGGNAAAAALRQQQQRVDDGEEDDSRWTIMLTVNAGYYDFFLNWYEHYRHIPDLADRLNLVVVAEDDDAHRKLTSLQLPRTTVVRSQLESSSAPASASGRGHSYETADYKSLVSSRATHLLNFLCNAGPDRDVIYVDVDTVWRSDPLPYLPDRQRRRRGGTRGDKGEQSIVDVALQVEAKRGCLASNLKPSQRCPKKDRVEPYYCTGLMAIVNDDRTIALLSLWERELQRNPQLNQPIFNQKLHRASSLHRVRHVALPVAQFPSGEEYFDNFDREQRKGVVAVHNNYIVGHDNKRDRFDRFGFWLVSEEK